MKSRNLPSQVVRAALMAVAGIALAVGVFAGPASASAEGAKYIHVDTDGYTVIAHGSEWG